MKVRLDADGLRPRLERQESAVTDARCRIARFRLLRTEVFYEELVARREEQLDRVLRFLDIEPIPNALESSFVRMNALPPAKLIENFDEVRVALAGTRFEWMLG